jgi:hypothetical protein
MKQVILDTAQATTPQELYAVLEREVLQQGDSVKVLQRPMDEHLKIPLHIVVLLAVIWYMYAKRKNDQFAATLLDDVFRKYDSAEELERELKATFDVTVTMETVQPPPSDWPSLTMATYEQAAYGEDEPDISGIAVREPNPEYRPWKKDA